MAKKKSPAELKEEGVALGEKIAQARKKPYKFALSIGKEGLVLETDLKKSPDILWRNAKKAGGGPKGAMGMMSVKGKIIELDCTDDSAPQNLPKLAKKFFAERGQPYKFVIKTPAGELSDDDNEEEEELQMASPPEEEEEELQMAVPPRGDAPPPEETAPPSASDEDAVDEETREAVEEVTGESPQEQTEASEDSGEDADDDTEDALREVLQKEFEGLSGDIEAARQGTNPGMVKKTDALVEMFGKQIGGDLKKSASVLSLLKATLKEAGGGAEATPAAGQAEGGAPDPAAAEARKSQLEELEKGVDALLAEFA